MNEKEMRDIVQETVKETLTQLGLDVENPLEMQMDFQAVREWRVVYGAMRKRAFLTGIGIMVTAFLAVAWIGLKSYLTGR